MIQVATDGYRFHNFYSKSTSPRPTQKVRVPKLQAGSPWKPRMLVAIARVSRDRLILKGV